MYANCLNASDVDTGEDSKKSFTTRGGTTNFSIRKIKNKRNKNLSGVK
jgi:hypothetical protein